MSLGQRPGGRHPLAGQIRLPVPMIIPFDSFARDIFGVLSMEKLVEAAEQAEVPFLELRDLVYREQLEESARDELRALARALSTPSLLVP